VGAYAAHAASRNGRRRGQWTWVWSLPWASDHSNEGERNKAKPLFLPPSGVV
jgi:hypothetical protein